MNTTENNTKIAKFLGYEITEGSQGKGIIRQGKHISLNKLKFHNDWNWLVEVTQKSLTVGDNTDEWDNLLNELQSLNIESLYKAVLDFIDWVQTK